MKPNPNLEPERRVFAAEGLELRADPAGGQDALPILTGYAAVFDRYSRVIRGPQGTSFVERIRPGAFARALRERQDVKALVNHDPTLVMGRTGNGTLKLEEDARGLRVELRPAPTTYARDQVATIRRKDVEGMSFGFRTVKDTWEVGRGPGGVDVRNLEDVDLFDVSPTSFPAYEDTAVAVRSLLDARAAAGLERPPVTPVSMVQPLEVRDLVLLQDPLPAWDEAEERSWTDRHPGELRSCFHDHLGLYLEEPTSLGARVAAARAGTLRPLEVAAGPRDAAPAGPPPKPWALEAGGVAVLRLEGSMAKSSKFASVGTVAMRRHLRAAAADQEVRAVLLVLDSPGGTAAGTPELGDEVRRLAASKPVHAYVEDLAASAAYWIGAQAQRMTVNATGQVGSIGVVSLVWDESKRYEREGVKVHVVATGARKAALREGQEVKPEDLAQVQDRVDFLFQAFRDAVVRGRRLSDEAFQAVADGRMLNAPAALQAGLVDGLGTYEDAVAAVLRQALVPPAAPAPAPTPEGPPATPGPQASLVDHARHQAAIDATT